MIYSWSWIKDKHNIPVEGKVYERDGQYFEVVAVSTLVMVVIWKQFNYEK